jgi:uncharacterized protein
MNTKGMLHYFKGSLIVLAIGVASAMLIVAFQNNSWGLILQAGLTALLLAVLEISLSFDNAVVNATVLKRMNDVWRKRFLTWGILVAVFGMRLVFPLAIVSIVAQINPISALALSFADPKSYSEMMLSAHVPVSAFGGIFLFMVFIHYFLNEEKETHWIHFFEKPMTRVAQFKGSELVITLLVLLTLSHTVADAQQKTFLVSGVWGIITFMLVHGLADLLESQQVKLTSVAASAGFGLFLYLEILDASFSFDGVIGAFALTNSLVQIMIGLGIGAFFVRSLTIYLVENETLDNFKYLEHGAFYALGALSFLMLFDTIFHVPEWLTGLSGALILGFSIFGSIQEDRQSRAK